MLYGIYIEKLNFEHTRVKNKYKLDTIQLLVLVTVLVLDASINVILMNKIYNLLNGLMIKNIYIFCHMK